MIVRVYAVVCANGEIHQKNGAFIGTKEPCLYVELGPAEVAQSWIDAEDLLGKKLPNPHACRPHGVVTLRGEVSLPRRPA